MKVYIVIPAFLLLCSSLWITSCTGEESPSSNSVSSAGERQDHLERINKHELDPSTGYHNYRFRFSGSDANEIGSESLSSFPAMQSLVYSASLYALHYEDYVVSLSEVVESGYWPFDLLPEGNPDNIILSDFRCPRLFSERMITDISSPEWIILVKSSLLNSFYTEYYTFPEFIADTASSASDSRIVPGNLTMLEQFWTDPRDGDPLEFGELRGMISETPLEWINFLAESRLEQGAEGHLVIIINDCDLYPAPFRENGRIISQA